VPRLGVARRAIFPILALLGFILVGFMWAYATPASSAADDDFHLPSIWCAWGWTDTCQPGEKAGSVLVPQRVAQSNCHVFGPVSDAGCVLSLSESLVETPRVNDGHNPGLFYSAMRLFVGGNSYQSVVIMRFVNVLLAAAMIALAAWTCRKRERLAFLLSWMALLVPVGMYFIASTNPSSWVFIGVGTFWAFLISTLRRGLRDRRGLIALVGAVASAVLALGSRIDSVIPLLVSAVAVLILSQRTVLAVVRRHRVGSAVGALSLLVVLIIVWVIGLGTRVQSSLGRLYVPPGDPARDQPNAVIKALAEMPTFLTSLVGGQRPVWVQRESAMDLTSAGYSTPAYFYGVGSMEFQLPAAVGAILTAVIGAVILLGFVDRRARKLVAFSASVVGLGGAILLTRASVGFVEWSSFFSSNIQPRYFFPYAILIVGVALIVRRRYWPILNRTQATFVLIGLVVAQAIALRGILARYIYGPDHSWTQLDGSRGWWWPSGPSPDTVWLVAVLASIVLYGSILHWAARPPLRSSGTGTNVEGMHPGAEAQAAPVGVVEGSTAGQHSADV